MKILHLIPQPRYRGAEIFASELFSSLKEKGVGGRLISLFKGEDETGITMLEGVPALGSNGTFPGVLLSLRKEIESYNPDVVLSHGGQPFKFAALSSLLMKGSPPLVYRKIGLSEQWLGSLRSLKLLFYRCLISRAARVISVGSSVTAELKDLFRIPERKIINIANATNPKRFEFPENARWSVRESLGIPAGAQVIITVGALSWEKNQSLIIKAFSEVRKSFPDIVLLLVGTGPEEGNLKRITALLKLDGSVRFLGSRPDVPGLLSASDIFVLTSLTEGVPGALIEAGMAGLPCVTSDVAGAREVVQHGSTGMVVPYKDGPMVIDSLSSLIRNPGKARQMGKAAREFCAERFDIRNCAEEHIRLFEEILSKSDR